MIAPSSPPLKRLLDYALMDQAYDAVQFSIKRVETYETFSRTMRKVTMAETRTSTGAYVTLEKYHNDIIKVAYPLAVKNLREFVATKTCEHMAPGLPPCIACIEAERPKIIEASLREAIARQPKPQGRLA
jgi:hypothetical protein